MKEAMNKRPGEVLDYVFDFTQWLSSGDKITDAEAVVSSIASAKIVASAEIDRVLFDDTTATAWVKGGTDGETANLTMRITTAMGRKKNASLRLRITE